jgi:E3 ubiquitin-protein ligase HUWE1
MYDPNLQGRDSSLISSSIGAPVVLEDEQGKMLQDVLRKYKPGRV